jgi:tRNA G18 (ribose-2'-O)-methylase SpoU
LFGIFVKIIYHPEILMRKLANSELNRINTQEFKRICKKPVIIVLDNVRSMHNIGSVFRTADAFLIEAIYLCGITAVPPNKEIHKTALGATESVNWKHFNTTSEGIEQLRKDNYLIYAVEQTDCSVMLNGFTIERNRKLAFVFGNEIHGVENNALKLTDGCIEIPQYGTKHSLNIAVSAGIVLWEVFNKIN